MLISFACDNCGRRYRVESEQVGKAALCKECGTLLKVPVPGPLVEEAPSGAPVYRHQARQHEFEPVTGDDETIAQVGHHLERTLGEAENVWHEIVSDLVHLDVHQVEPSDEFPFWTLVTSGMSARPMQVPEGAEEFAFAELAICLPREWPLTTEAFKDERNYWPIRLLKSLARMPHEYDTWLGPAHSIHNGETEITPYASNTQFCAAMLVPPLAFLPPDFGQCETDSGKLINFYSIWPLYQEELDYKLKHGFDGLLDRLAAGRVTEVVDVRRANTCRKKKWWQLW